MEARSHSDVLDKLQGSLAAIFDQAQLSLANHRKNCVALYKLHQLAGSVTQSMKSGTVVKYIGERKFGDAFIGMVTRVLAIKKGPATADRVVKFIGSYVKFMNEKASADKEKAQQDPSSSISARTDEDCDDDTVASRFVARLLKWLMHGFLAKNKTTRYRTVCIVSEMIVHLGEIDEDTYNILRDGLIGRICDKESMIRVHAVTALSKLVGSEDPDDVEPGEKTILEVLLDVVSHDPAAEVRRAGLVSIPFIPPTKDTLLSRTRDTDPLTRKLVYSNVLQNKLGHPRQLTIAQRELVMKDGLGDREPSVRVAAGKLATSWFDIVLAEPDEYAWAGDDGGTMKAFLKFLALFDVVGPGEAIAVDAMLSIFVTRPSIPDAFVFPDVYWKELSPESAVLARVFVEHCLSIQNEARLESASLPVVTAFAFYLQEAYNVLIAVLQEIENAAFVDDDEVDREEKEQREEELAKHEVILGELLRMALKLDYMDEIGRRKVFTVIKDMIAHPELPRSLINPCLDVLKEILPTERELIRVVVEIIIDLREDEDNNDGKSILDEETQDPDATQATITKGRSIQPSKPRDEMSLDEQRNADVRDLRCLSLCIGMLERVDSSFEDNSTLEGIMTDLIVPSVKRKELVMRGKGLISLALCCLIAKNMALNSFQLFLGQVQSAPEELKIRVLQVIFDLLVMYDHEFFGRTEDIAQKIITFLLQTLESEESASVQAVLCVGLSKLLLYGMITEPKVLTCLVLTYVSPVTATNLELRQCLSYFFPVYCYSSLENQRRMQSIFVTVFDLFVRARENLDEDEEMITPQQFGLLLVDWTNPEKSAEIPKDETSTHSTHVELAIDILGALYDSERSDEDLKVLCQLLGHLQIMPGLDHRSIHKLNILLKHHNKQCPFNDNAIEKIFNKFYSRFTTIFVKELQYPHPGHDMDEDFLEIYKFIGVDPPDEIDAPVVRTVSPSVLSQSLAASSDDENEQATVEEEDSSPTPSPKQTKGKRRRTVPGRKKAPPNSPPVSEVEDTVGDEMVTPLPIIITPKKTKGVKRIHTPGSSTPLTRKKTRTTGSRKTRSVALTTESESEGDETPIEQESHRLSAVNGNSIIDESEVEPNISASGADESDDASDED